MRHGKDTVAEYLQSIFGFTFQSSSQMACDLFIYDGLKEKYNYTSSLECFLDRGNHRAEWHDLICDYNKDDKARIAKEIMKKADIYVGMRSNEEVEECINQDIFELIIGVYNPRLPEEDKSSFNINIWEKSDFVIPNSGTLEDLEQRIIKLSNVFFKN